MNSPRICLNMIVKNEAAIIERCLRSLAGVVDCCVICDTGSTDDTPDRIRDWLLRNSLPGEIHHIPFVDFGTTRNRALDLCRQSSETFDYVLLADADMELVAADVGFKSRLSAAAYSVQQVHGIAYDNIRLLRRDAPSRYVGATHEYLEVNGAVESLGEIWFLDHACGANRGDKVERDIRLLREALRRNPADARSLFYLAQTYRDAGQYGRAIACYDRRSKLGGFDDEAWYSLYRMADCYSRLGMEAAMSAACDLARSRQPHRLEPLLMRARHRRLRGDYAGCMTDCRLAQADMPITPPKGLFVETQAYETGFDAEVSIAAYYLGDDKSLAEGRQATLRLTTDPRADAATRSAAQRNSYYYAQTASDHFGPIAFTTLDVATEPGYLPLNPSIWGDESGLSCVIRSVNYRVENMRYHIQDTDGVVRTRNFFARLVPTLCQAFQPDISPRHHLAPLIPPAPALLPQIGEVHAMRDRTGVTPDPTSRITGFEDCRLFRCRDRFWCVATVVDRNPNLHCEIAILELDDRQDVIGCRIIREINPDQHQKNWSPLVRGDDLFLIYGHDPTVVLHYDFETSTASVAYRGRPELRLGSFRGGSQAIRVEDQWITIVHEACYIDTSTRFYGHRFVSIADDFRVRAITDPFYFQHKGIEFCAGLAFDAANRRFLASFGVDDREARLASIDADRVLDSLRPIAQFNPKPCRAAA